MTTEILGLDEILASQSQKEVAHNTALRQIEGRLVRVLSKALAAPPTSPVSGDSYIVAASPTAAWSGQAGKIAHYFGGAWKFWQPIEGVRLWVNDEDKVYAWDGSAWIVTGGDPAAAIAAHVAASDPHPTYLTQTEGDARYSPAGGGAETAATIGALINGAASKVTPADADQIGLMDSAASNVLKKLSWANIKAALKSYFDTLYVTIGTVNAFTKNQSVAASALTSGTTVSTDASLSNNFKLTLATNGTLANPTNLTEGMILNFAITQDGTGSRTLAYGSLFKFPGGTAPVLSTAAGAKDFMSCYYDGAALLCQMSKGFA
jgi:hypothetical protein